MMWEGKAACCPVRRAIYGTSLSFNAEITCFTVSPVKRNQWQPCEYQIVLNSNIKHNTTVWTDKYHTNKRELCLIFFHDIIKVNENKVRNLVHQSLCFLLKKVLNINNITFTTTKSGSRSRGVRGREKYFF